LRIEIAAGFNDSSGGAVEESASWTHHAQGPGEGQDEEDSDGQHLDDKACIAETATERSVSGRLQVRADVEVSTATPFHIRTSSGEAEGLGGVGSEVPKGAHTLGYQGRGTEHPNVENLGAADATTRRMG
jgi:hypothetical protein